MGRTIVLFGVAAVVATGVVGLAGAHGTSLPACAPGSEARAVAARPPPCERPPAVPALSTWSAATREPATAKPVFTPFPCPDVFPLDRTVDCGTITVPENRSRPNGRSITVAAAVMRATTRRPKADPIVFVDGGPSFGAISDFAAYSYFGGASYADEARRRPRRHPRNGSLAPRLGCPEFDQADEASFFAKPYFYAHEPLRRNLEQRDSRLPRQAGRRRQRPRRRSTAPRAQATSTTSARRWATRSGT